MICQISLIKSDGTEVNPDYIMSFVFEKDAYTPYTRLSAEFMNRSNALPSDCYGVKLRLGAKTVHFGIADVYHSTRSSGCYRGSVSSRGYTSMLMENQIQPGLYTGITIDSLFSTFCPMQNIEHESNDATSYIFVKPGSSMWDSIANLSFKLFSRYPYIKGANTVTMSLPQSPKSLDLSFSKIFEYGSVTDTRKLASDFHMEDISGNYGTFDLSEPEAVNRSIVRHRYFELDRRFLSHPIMACEYRNMHAKFGLRRRTLTYSEYKGEDLFDRVTGGGITDKPILGIKVTGNKKGIITRLETEY